MSTGQQGKDRITEGFQIGEGIRGKGNRITDVPGVKVGHYTISDGENKTGVTAVIPCEGLVFKRKPEAAVYVLNGYGKTTGTVQVEELGMIETPILLTNTLNVGKAADGLISYTIRECEKAGFTPTSVNPVVGETNDSRISRIVNRVIGEREVLAAIDSAEVDFAQGAVGAGRGTVCFGLKGGIGSASRIVSFGGETYTIGALVQSNFGSLPDLVIDGDPIGKRIDRQIQSEIHQDKGSIMVIIGTDIPLDSRQLKRVLKRASVGLVRTGSHMGTGSGDIFIGFTNGNFRPEQEAECLNPVQCFPENHMDLVFRPAAEAVEEAILNSMLYAEREIGVNGEVFYGLKEFL